MRNSLYFLVFLCCFFSCKNEKEQGAERKPIEKLRLDGVSLVVLGTVQDAGSPHIACKKNCCAQLFDNPDNKRQVVSLGLIDAENKKTIVFEATPNLSTQLKDLKRLAPWDANELPDGIFLTHAHIGHYTGLMYLGKEATNASQVPVYAMPNMASFLEKNGPWSQLISSRNIKIIPITNAVTIPVSSNISVVPLKVPHRDEFSETVGYRIIGPNKSALFIPDIDKWEKWEIDIETEIATVDFAFIDATFFDGEELNARDISQIPHPFVIESMALLKNLNKTQKAKVHFIHFNHTNPLLRKDSPQTKKVLANGFKVARKGIVFSL